MPPVRTIPLDKVELRDRSSVGPKAANLARLMRRGLPVPFGFCVTGAAYREHVASAALASRLEETVRALAGALSEQREKTLCGLRDAIAAAPLAGPLRDEVEHAWRALGAERAAVRSSATAEDMPGRSFAGQYDTHLGVASLEECLEALAKCWGSLWTDRAFGYRERSGIDHLRVEMAVIVQKLVPADAAGVLFTADPVTGERGRMIIEGCFGLGEAVVGGRVSPDRLVVLRDELRVVERVVSEKALVGSTTSSRRRGVEIVPGEAGGVIERPVVQGEDAARATRPVIDEVTALRLAVLGARAEEEFGCPQDLEWAVSAGKVSVLQSRPITALPEPPKPRRSGIIRRLTGFLRRETAGAEPEAPVASERPAAPEGPAAPGEPVEPEAPTASDEPAVPEEPAAPEEESAEPEAPAASVGPVVPEALAVPEEPAEPAAPAASEEPAVPEAPAAPEEPVVPEEPAAPEEPVVPGAPAASEEPAAPEAPAASQGPPEPKERSREDRQFWTRANAGEVLPDVMTPMTWSVVQPIVRRLFGALFDPVRDELDRLPLFELVAGRAYFNLNTFIACLHCVPAVRKKKFSELFGGAGPHADGADGPDGVPIPEEDIPRLSVGFVRSASFLPQLVWRLVTRSPAGGRRHVRRLRAETDAMCAADLGGLTDEELAGRCIAVVNDILGSRDSYIFAGTGLMYSIALFEVCRRYFRPPIDGMEGSAVAAKLLAGLGGYDNAEAGLGPWRLAAFARRHAELAEAILSGGGFVELREELAGTRHGEEFLRRWREFMRRHGHHARGEMELANARWSERPDHVLGLVRGYLGNTPQVDPEARRRKIAAERKALARKCKRRLGGLVKRLVFSFVLRRAQLASPIRENLKSGMVRRLALVRRMLLELGRSLVFRRVLAEPDDVLFLTLEELAPVLSEAPGFDVRGTATARRAEYERNLTLTPPLVFVGRPGREDLAPEEPGTARGAGGEGARSGRRRCPDDAARSGRRRCPDDAAREFTGVAVCSGVVEGPARVILQSGAEQVLPGEVLVAPSTDPGWAPYFVNAAAVVMDMGGILSHGSIVAREYGVPCVVNVGPATKIVKTGQMLRVDGDRGEVTILAASCGPRRGPDRG